MKKELIVLAWIFFLLPAILSGQLYTPGEAVVADRKNKLPSGTGILPEFRYIHPDRMQLKFRFQNRADDNFALLLIDAETFNYDAVRSAIERNFGVSQVGSSISGDFDHRRVKSKTFFNYSKDIFFKENYKSGFSLFRNESSPENYFITDINKLLSSQQTGFSYTFLVVNKTRRGAEIDYYTSPIFFAIPAPLINNIRDQQIPVKDPPTTVIADAPEPDPVVAEKTEPEPKPDPEPAKPVVTRPPTQRPAADPCKEFEPIYQRHHRSVTRNRTILESDISREYSKFQNRKDSCLVITDPHCWINLNQAYEIWQNLALDQIAEFNTNVRTINSEVENHNIQHGQLCRKELFAIFDVSLRRKVEALGRSIAEKVIDQSVMLQTVREFQQHTTILKDKVDQFVASYDRKKLDINHYNPYTGRNFNQFTLSVKNRVIADLESFAKEKDGLLNEIYRLRQQAESFYLEKSSVVYSAAIFENRSGLDEANEKLSVVDPEIQKSQVSQWPYVEVNYLKYVFWGLAGLILLFGAFIYMKMIRRKREMLKKGYFRPVAVNKAFTPNAHPIRAEKPAPGSYTRSSADYMDGIEVVEEESVIMKAKGLDHLKQWMGGQYYEIDLKDQWENTAVRKVFFHKDCIIKTYRYFEDLQMSYSNPEDIDEHGGFLIGRWDFNPFDNTQYDLSIEDFITPGDDAKFTKYNIEFGNDIAQNLEGKLANYAKKGFECIMTAWIHSHPGHSVFLSNFDLNVQDQFRDHGHENRTIAIVIEPRTEKWEMGIFSFRNDSEMNNTENMKKLFYFDDLFNWAISNASNQMPNQYYQKTFPLSDLLLANTVSFSNRFIISMKRFNEDTQINDYETISSVIEGQRILLTSNRYNYFLDELVNEKENGETNQGGISNIPLGLLMVNENDLTEDQIQQYLKERELTYNIEIILIYNRNEQSFKMYSKTKLEPLAKTITQPLYFKMKEIISFRNR